MDVKSNTFQFLPKDIPQLTLTGIFVARADLEHCALLVEIELNSGGQLLLLWAQVLHERGREPDGALGDGGVPLSVPSEPGIPTDLRDRWDMKRHTNVLTA